VLAVLDTSASMTAETLRQIGGELAGMSRAADVVVAECDTRIHGVYPYRDDLLKVHGRGGTDLRPALAAAFLAGLRPDVVVYFMERARRQREHPAFR
jgi:predicted metal-dependent peptidase